MSQSKSDGYDPPTKPPETPEELMNELNKLAALKKDEMNVPEKLDWTSMMLSAYAMKLSMWLDMGAVFSVGAMLNGALRLAELAPPDLTMERAKTIQLFEAALRRIKRSYSEQEEK